MVATNYDRLLRELTLLSALKDHVDPSDPSPERSSINRAWRLARERAAKAADDYANNPES
jgi:hypothetical protein